MSACVQAAVADELQEKQVKERAGILQNTPLAKLVNQGGRKPAGT